MALDFPANPVNNQVYDNYYYDSLIGAWRGFGTGTPPNPLLNAIAKTSSASGVPLTIQGYTSQSANLQEWENSSGTVLSSINSAGALSLATPLTVANGGTGAITLTSGGYLKGAGTSAITSQSGIPAGDITSGTLATARLPIIPVANGGTGVTTGTGLAVIIPTSVAVGSGTGSYDSSTGQITFSGASSIAVNGCFTSTYRNYRLIASDLQSNTGYPGINFYLRASGTNATTEYWNWGVRAVSSAGITQRGANATSAMEVLSGVGSGGKYQSISMDITTPQIASNTTIMSQATGFDSSSAMWQNQSCFKNDSTSYDGFALLLSAGTFSGNIKIYGYN